MGKYDALEGHLRRQRLAELEMSFREIERVIGALLPKSAHRPQWWANERDFDSAHVQCQAWLRAGYEASVATRAEKVRFKRPDGREAER